MSQLTCKLSQYWDKIQGTLFPQLEEELDPLTERQQQLVTILELVRIEQFIPDYRGYEGRPQKTRSAIARSFIAKMEMLHDLPKMCNKGAKKDSHGNIMYWTGYKLHLDTIDGGIPVSAIITSASMHDSQAAIPLANLTARKITNLYDLMDSAYYVPGIIEHSESLGHVPLIDKNPRANKELKKNIELEAKARSTLNWKPAEDIRYNVRSTAERANSRLKDEFGACKVRVRGCIKVACHLMFGVLVLAADQLMKIVT